MSLADQKYDHWRQKYIRSSSKGIYVWYNDSGENGNAVTVSEAMGYGMLISVLKRNQPDFDGMLAFFEAFKNRNGLMMWQIDDSMRPANGEEGMTSATDGDIDIAAALFLAARVWGRGGPQGNIDYRAKATDLSRAIHRCNINHTTNMPNLGDWAVPGSKLEHVTRGSDFILSHFLLFYQEDTQMRGQWQAVIEAVLSATMAQYSLHPNTGLIADFMQWKHGQWKPVHGKILESEKDGDYNYNSCRAPWRLAHYYHLSRDQRILPILHAQAAFFRREIENRGEIRAGYKLDGKPTVDYGDRCFTAPIIYLFWALGDMEMTNRAADMLNDDEEQYFGATIDMLATLQAHVPY